MKARDKVTLVGKEKNQVGKEKNGVGKEKKRVEKNTQEHNQEKKGLQQQFPTSRVLWLALCILAEGIFKINGAVGFYVYVLVLVSGVAW